MKSLRSLLISCLLALALAHASNAAHPPALTSTPVARVLYPRQSNAAGGGAAGGGAGGGIIPGPNVSLSATSAEPSNTSSSTTPTNPASSTSAPPPDDPKSTSSTASAPPSDTSVASSTTSPPPAASTPTPTVSPILTESQVTTTDAQGQTSVLTITSTMPPSSSSAAPSSTETSNSDDNSGLSTGSIVGMSVAGGVAVIGIVGFFIWKFTRKRFSDFDDNEAIKWPELNNTHSGAVDSHPLPVHNTGRAGFETGSEASLSRVNSTNYSTSDFAGGSSQDPYAVPPLPHMNPNQPYRDDPTAATGYYDPYRGPVPGTLENGGGAEWGGEAYPMTQMSAGAGGAGRMSPGPHAAMRAMSPPVGGYGAEPAYDAGGANPMFDPGRRSPGPQQAFGAVGGRTSPGPQMAYGGRGSPGPHAAYDGYGGQR
ncbi:hypothetical protein BDQ12DRAFT_734137 [Crucibulum laeve]|uniref:Mid2 domain-containing protein n=1 Tax=Crucibulum laeve TaxID=68775 RepID=A0A5C3M656_9AGAR|nr:hypothetical protein BDQ12DRAFT_734137 [Crucibulum laeve]